MSGAGAHRLVIVGAGFGGLQLALKLGRDKRFAITLLDRRNHHTFQPLLYQAATAILPPSQIAWPIRRLMRGRPSVTTRLGEVIGVDAEAREVRLADGERLAYDSLVLATGVTHAYFGHDDWAPFAPGLKTLEDATAIRGRILMAFERAEAHPRQAEALLTFAIVGAGPTGVELAGAIAELARTHLKDEFRHIDARRARVVLLEAGPRILPSFAEDLAAYALRALHELGVEVRTRSPVTACDAQGVVTDAGRLDAATVIWAAGVQASPAADWLGVAADRVGRVPVLPDLTAPGHPEVFVIGDTAQVPWKAGAVAPGIAPAAKQQGAYVARVLKGRLKDRLNGRPTPPFRYRHQGSLATIGRNRAIIDFGALRLTGFLAWWLWGVAHIYFLIGARSRLAVSLDWLWAYARNEPAARLITGKPK
ncbi:MAG TPA: NAD(P)/FAD-dependent oxidoreductase [Caulobacteraceae bacterium]